MFFSSWFFLRSLGCIYFLAFASLWLQVEGLIGSEGILPAKEYLDLLYQKFGAKSYFIAPTLFWLAPKDAILHLLCGLGLGFSALLGLGLLPSLSLGALWVLYLSFLSIGQVFLSFQWDILLLETGFLAIFFSLSRSHPDSSCKGIPSLPFLWLLRWLLFRLMFASAYVKLASDPVWFNLSALNYHYETQPLPTWLAWYAYQLPSWFQKLSAAGTLGIEGLLPFLIFGPRGLRNIAFFGLAGLQVLIILTGNYGFFNLLSISLCILLLDDTSWKKFFSFIGFRRAEYFVGSFFDRNTKAKVSPYKKYILRIAALLIFFYSLLLFSTQFLGYAALPGGLREFLRSLRPLHIVGTYGLFANMTKTRPEIVVEGSKDGLLWREYRFKWKVQSLRESPQQVAPHQPRLDWQMWFAALRKNCRHSPWFLSFVNKLLRDNPTVSSLLEKDPFPKEAPRYIRALLYSYQFTDFSTRVAERKYWQRKKLGLYCPPLWLKDD